MTSLSFLAVQFSVEYSDNFQLGVVMRAIEQPESVELVRGGEENASIKFRRVLFVSSVSTPSYQLEFMVRTVIL